jgi:hypothetical protein
MAFIMWWCYRTLPVDGNTRMLLKSQADRILARHRAMGATQLLQLFGRLRRDGISRLCLGLAGLVGLVSPSGASRHCTNHQRPRKKYRQALLKNVH